MWQLNDSVCGERLEHLYCDVQPELKEEHTFVNGICNCGYLQPEVVPTAPPIVNHTACPIVTPAVLQAQPPKSIAIAQQNQKVNIGDALQLTVEFSPEGADSELSWSSSDKKIATVDANGVVTSVKEGSVTITAKSANGKKATIKIMAVDPYKPTSVKLDKTGTVNLNLGESLTLTPSLAPETAQATYTWKTSSTKIAKVEGGVVTPVAEGTATITVTVTRGSVKKTASVKVKVVEPYVVDALVLSHRDTPKDLKVKVGELCDVTVSVKPASAQATANLSFTASNGNVSVTKQASNKFRVSGVKAGTTTITVKDVNTGVKTTMKVVVTK